MLNRMAKKNRFLDLWWVEKWEPDVAVVYLPFVRQIIKGVAGIL